jgi:outer membrane protein assembly factor BamB
MIRERFAQFKSVYLNPVFFLLILGTLGSVPDCVYGDQWNGWRGLHLQGRSVSSEYPKQWSDSSNVLWCTEIKGDGHSSPVVSDSSVFVTSAWHVDDKPIVKKILTYFIFTGSLLLLLFLVPFLLATCRSENKLSRREFISVLAFWMLIGLLFHSLFFSYWLPEGFSFSDSLMQFTLWFHSGVIVALCLILSVFHLPQNSRKRFFTAIFAVTWGVFLLLARPYPEYYRIANIDILRLTRMFIPFLFIVSVGITLLLLSIRAKQKPGSDTVIDCKPGKRLSSFRIFLVLSAFLLGLSGFATFININLSKIFYFLLAHGRYSFPEDLTTISDRIKFLFDLSFSYPWFLVIANLGFIIWLIIETSKFNKDRIRLPFWFSTYIILLGFLSFITTNYLSQETMVERGIICLDRKSGKVKWQKGSLIGSPVNRTRLNSPATPTPVIDGERVYAYFGTPGIICTDYDGNLLWTNTDLPFEGIHGIGASPVISGDHIIILGGMSVAPYLTAIDRHTGKRVWTVNLEPWSGLHGKHRTPLITNYQGRDVIIDWGSSSQPGVSIYYAQSGEKIGTYPTNWNIGGQVITTVLIEGDVLYLSGMTGVHALSLSKIVQSVDPLVWETNLHNKGPNTASPVFDNGILFMVSDHGWATCLDAGNGELLWQERLEYGKYYSSLVVAGGFVYFSNIEGITTIVECNRSFNTGAKNILSEGLFASPAIVDGQLFMRTSGRIWCLYDKGEYATTSSE